MDPKRSFDKKSINVLPLELQYQFLYQLDYVDIINYCKTSSEKQRICDDPLFWRNKARHDYPQYSHFLNVGSIDTGLIDISSGKTAQESFFELSHFEKGSIGIKDWINKVELKDRKGFISYILEEVKHGLLHDYIEYLVSKIIKTDNAKMLRWMLLVLNKRQSTSDDSDIITDAGLTTELLMTEAIVNDSADILNFLFDDMSNDDEKITTTDIDSMDELAEYVLDSVYHRVEDRDGNLIAKSPKRVTDVLFQRLGEDALMFTQELIRIALSHNDVETLKKIIHNQMITVEDEAIREGLDHSNGLDPETLRWVIEKTAKFYPWEGMNYLTSLM